MRAFYISNIDYSDARLLARKYSQRLNRVGCGICIDSEHDSMIIKWKVVIPTTISCILDFVDYAFWDDTVYDTQDILELKIAIKNLEDGHVVIFDSNNCECEIREL